MEDAMTDIATTTTIALRRFRRPNVVAPLRAIGAGLGAMSQSIGRAFAMAYAEPYASRHPREIAAEDRLDGRNPDW